jgi:hypothetical protein
MRAFPRTFLGALLTVLLAVLRAGSAEASSGSDAGRDPDREAAEREALVIRLRAVEHRLETLESRYVSRIEELAQIAALGSIFALVLGYDPHAREGYAFSLFFTFIGAAIFSISRLRDQRIPQARC